MRMRPGFTIMELLVVMGAMLLLITMTAASVSTAQARARNVKRKVEARAIVNSIIQYQADHAEALPPGVDGTSRMIGTSATGCSISCHLGISTTTEVVLLPSADSYMYQYLPTQNFGTQTSMQLYPWNAGAVTRRGLIRFNLSSIPSDVTVLSATLSLKESATYGVTRQIGVYRATRDWTETGVTWNRYNTLTSWTTPGGDFVTPPSAVTSVAWTGGVLDWDTWDVTNDVQQMLNGTYDNYGWIVKHTTDDNSEQYWYFNTKESGANSPTLRIRYGAITIGDNVAEACSDLSLSLVPGYLYHLPIDPKFGTAEKTYYVIRKANNGEIFVRACGAELGETIIAQGK
ncbi:MAG TPA: DNRLRE domain-containing protein [Candidatus Kapabacteria bacterium]|nr:DNRLRE domain-containing protein [Candidatus Kapabacteria bacterium]